MARTKRTSTVLEAARKRLAGLKSITPAPDFGPGMDIPAYEEEINAFSGLLNSYNEQLSGIDQTQNKVDLGEDALLDKNGRYLAATKARYGPDSSEYEAVGGTRQSERKRPGPRTPRQKSPTA